MLHFFKRAAATVANALPNKLRLFADTDGFYKTKDELGVVTLLGDGITTIALISTVGLVKTYRITRQSGVQFNYTISDGRGIVSVAKINTVGLVDTYRITFDTGAPFDYTVTNGRDGLDGQGQPATVAPTTIDPDDAAAIGTQTARYALEDHQHAITAAAPTANLTAATTNAEGTGTAFSRNDHSHAISTAAPIQIVAGATAGAGNSTELARASHVHSVSTGAAVALGAANGEGTSTALARADHVHLNPVIAHEAAGDPHPQYTTTAEAAAAAPVQSVAGKTGAVTLTNADVGLGNVRNPAVLDVRTVTAQTLNQTLTTIGTITIPANSLVAGDAFEIDVIFGTLVNTTAASNLEVAIFLNGTQNAIAIATMGTTAVAAPGRGGRALFKAVFRTVGANGTALANGTIHVNNIANFASNNVTAQTVNTTANITLDVRARTSVATTTGTVQMVAIEQCT